MAKGKSKKKSGKSPQVKMTPQRYIRERARKLPIDKCFINSDWQESGLAQILVIRNRPDGNYVFGVYLVDVFCLGLKDSFCNNDASSEKLQEVMLYTFGIRPREEISYNEAHNIIYGAIAFAEEAGIPPIKDFDLTQYVLEEDTEDIPLIEYEFGKDGKYYLICGEAYPRDKMFIEPLKKRLGDKFNYISRWKYEDRDDFDDFDDYDDDDSSFMRMQDEMSGYPDEVYSYKRPEYPATLELKNKFIADEFYNPDYIYTLPGETIDKILALPADEAASDIANLIMYEIGRTWKQIENDEDENVDLNHSALLHSIILLAHIDSDKALDAILEIMRQTSTFADYHFGDLAPEYIHLALYMAGKNDTHAIENYMNEPGYMSYMRGQAPQALAFIAANYPEKREEVIGIFRRLLKSMVDRLPRQEACDGHFAGSVMADLIDIQADELIPEIKEVFATEEVDPIITGDMQKVVREISNPDSVYVSGLHPMTIEEQYAHLKSFDPNERAKYK